MGAALSGRRKSARPSSPSAVTTRKTKAKPTKWRDGPKPERRADPWTCLRRGCRAIVPDAGTVCLDCLLKDAAVEEMARRVHAVSKDQSCASGADAMRREFDRRTRNRDTILKAIVKATAGTAAFPLVLAAGLDRLLRRATADSPPFKRWLAAKGVSLASGGWTHSPSRGRSARSSAGGSG